MRRQQLQALVICLAANLLLACADQRFASGDISLLAEDAQYKVQRGDTLNHIAYRFGKDAMEIARVNNISPPYIIHPGQFIYLNKIPPAAKSTARPAKKPPVNKSVASSGQTRKQSVSKKKHYKVAAKHNENRWLWPVKGKVVAKFSSTSPVNKGIDIEAPIGSAILSTQSGVVVYAGSKLKGYGKLIIVKHNPTYLSAYAHNKSILVQEGEQVRQGQKIATLGMTGTQSPKLHFEIRKNGKPMNPEAYLK